ncbi:ATP-binding protein, partial [Streptomyces thinghirensis]|uniref:ATP-binding protein n=1 Tax=Streptomyces thinghirensis TaxID=551547 RepID=UPI0031EC86DC
MTASHQLDRWGRPYRTPVHDAAELVADEPAANAVTHGRVPGRDAESRLAHDGDGRILVEVSDVRGERRPVLAPEGGSRGTGAGRPWWLHSPRSGAWPSDRGRRAGQYGRWWRPASAATSLEPAEEDVYAGSLKADRADGAQYPRRGT